jgi:hypothetical protein
MAGKPLQDQYPFCKLDLSILGAASGTGLQAAASQLGKDESARSELPRLGRMLSRTVSVNGLRRTINLQALGEPTSDKGEGGSPQADIDVSISDSVTSATFQSALAKSAEDADLAEEPLTLPLIKSMTLEPEQPQTPVLPQRRLLRQLSTIRPRDRSKFVLDVYGHHDEAAREALDAYKLLHKQHKELLQAHLWDMADEVQQVHNLVPVKMKDKELLARALHMQLQQADKLYFQAAAWVEDNAHELAKVSCAESGRQAGCTGASLVGVAAHCRRQATSTLVGQCWGDLCLSAHDNAACSVIMHLHVTCCSAYLSGGCCMNQARGVM